MLVNCISKFIGITICQHLASIFSYHANHTDGDITRRDRETNEAQTKEHGDEKARRRKYSRFVIAVTTGGGGRRGGGLLIAGS